MAGNERRPNIPLLPAPQQPNAGTQQPAHAAIAQQPSSVVQQLWQQQTAQYQPAPVPAYQYSYYQAATQQGYFQPAHQPAYGPLSQPAVYSANSVVSTNYGQLPQPHIWQRREFVGHESVQYFFPTAANACIQVDGNGIQMELNGNVLPYQPGPGAQPAQRQQRHRPRGHRSGVSWRQRDLGDTWTQNGQGSQGFGSMTTRGNPNETSGLKVEPGVHAENPGTAIGKSVPQESGVNTNSSHQVLEHGIKIEKNTTSTSPPFEAIGSLSRSSKAEKHKHASKRTLERPPTTTTSRRPHATTSTSTFSPRAKRIKDEPPSPPSNLRPAVHGWGNFLQRIKQDDQITARKARDKYECLGGDVFRPELRETYKDSDGRKESKVHEKVEPIQVAVKREESGSADDEGGVKLEA